MSWRYYDDYGYYDDYEDYVDEDCDEHEQPFECEHERAGGPGDHGFGEKHGGAGVTLASCSAPSRQCSRSIALLTRRRQATAAKPARSTTTPPTRNSVV